MFVLMMQVLILRSLLYLWDTNTAGLKQVAADLKAGQHKGDW